MLVNKSKKTISSELLSSISSQRVYLRSVYLEGEVGPTDVGLTDVHHIQSQGLHVVDRGISWLQLGCLDDVMDYLVFRSARTHQPIVRVLFTGETLLEETRNQSCLLNGQLIFWDIKIRCFGNSISGNINNHMITSLFPCRLGHRIPVATGRTSPTAAD